MKWAISCPQGQGHGGAFAVGEKILNSTQISSGLIETMVYGRFHSYAMPAPTQPPDAPATLTFSWLHDFSAH